jgi:hypothetical protein
VSSRGQRGGLGFQSCAHRGPSPPLPLPPLPQESLNANPEAVNRVAAVQKQVDDVKVRWGGGLTGARLTGWSLTGRWLAV